ncbi:nucleotidyltransferase family protein [Psychroserpens burtonensis]|uniref:Nucleotidyltransferase family protein n=1 Tax=Psychroserpens burtonensis TaxID=49278 RepID=A0A5C7BAL4_9FLAO|nr:nucleotidyltransferase family protein [Psychroserpens burtonensis]TXE18874.1 nucleotidyltransferase family protein [Psychroserpens burtonensis]
MPSIKNTYKETLRLIADILSFKNSIEGLKLKLSSSTIDWDQFVTIASNHLVLPACYCRLSQKELLIYLPKDLVIYLKEITHINRNRNHSLMTQVTHITDIFNKNNINYTLLKGTALLAGNYFEDPGERMVGDIDILVELNEVNKSYGILLKEGYTDIEQTLGSKYFEHKHLPRLIPLKFIGAVEVHRKVLIQPYKGILNAEEILNSKKNVKNISIPNRQHLLEHSILNFQVNDFGYFYNSMSLRSLYDTMIIMKTLTTTDTGFLKLPFVKSYIAIGHLFFSDFNDVSSNTFRSQLFLKRMNNKFLKKITDILLKKSMLIKLICHRSFFFVKNKNYRIDIIKDYRRILSLLKSKF